MFAMITACSLLVMTTLPWDLAHGHLHETDAATQGSKRVYVNITITST